MSSRRSRIKGIANIPQRRKPENEKFKEEGDQLSADSKLETKCEVNDSKIIISKNEPTKSISEDKHLLPNHLEENPDTIKDLIVCPASTEQAETVEENVIREELPEVNAIPASNKPPTAFKRKFLKAPVSINAIKKRKKTEEVKPDNPGKRQETDANDEISKKSIDNYVNIDSQSLSVTESEIRSDDATPGITVSVSENNENIFQKPASLFNNTTHSDTEYPIPPPSPNKANRSRIKAIPRLAHRKTSFSASESEDESKKLNRNRNDSVCSTTSAVAESFTECFSPQRPKETITVSQPKKNAIRLEQTRKLAEARREFVRRFGYKKPERHRLTMMDLIFYNPETNPMVTEGDTTKESDTVIDADDPTNNEENVDEPSNTNDTQSDEENEIPVPQIKIGPSGEIILDEQSLVIERKEVQRKREELEKSTVVDLDKIKTGYGIYKQNKRTKFWTASETVYFYKALNTIGTDFTLMCELFPNRTRRELKIKFKKEEKLNRNLIDKALMQPCNFDYEDLKSEIELEERELEAIKKHEEEEKKLKEEICKENRRIAMEKIQKRKAEGTVQKTYIPKPKPMPRVPNLETPKQAVTKPKVKVSPKNDNPLKLKPSKRSKKPKLSIQTYMSDSDADESDIATQSESDEDVVLSNKPTRSGRVPKATQRYDNEFSSIASIMKRNKIPDKERPENIEPGSIMVITENGPNGEPVYKLYMVTPEQKATPLDVPRDLAEAIQLKKGMTAKSIMTISANLTDDEEIPPENNITISADENVTSLKEETNITIPADENVISLRSEANNKEKEEKNAVSDDQNIKGDQIDGENEGSMSLSEEEVDKTASSDGSIEENTISNDHIKEGNENNGVIEENTIFDDHIKEGNEENGVIEENTIFDDHVKEGNEENGVIEENTMSDVHIKEGNKENGVIEENTMSDDHIKEGNEENGVVEENTMSDDHIKECNEENSMSDDDIKEGNEENGVIEENTMSDDHIKECNEENAMSDDDIKEGNEENGVIEENICTNENTAKSEEDNETIKVISFEPLGGYRDLEKNCSTENVRVIATDSNTVILNHDNFVFDNDDEDEAIVLEVNNDGICMKLENDSGNLRTPAGDSSEVRKLTT